MSRLNKGDIVVGRRVTRTSWSEESQDAICVDYFVRWICRIRTDTFQSTLCETFQHSTNCIHSYIRVLENAIYEYHPISEVYLKHIVLVSYSLLEFYTSWKIS